MKFLYAPWRENYIVSDHKNSACPFCPADGDNDRKKYIIKRYEHVYLMLNLYPYNPGHLMVIPFNHVDQISKLTPEAQRELIETTAHASDILQKTLHADGVNIGMNIGGYAAGGTIPEHIHMHVLPRFKGDTNFLPLLADTKQVSRDLDSLYAHLLEKIIG